MLGVDSIARGDRAGANEEASPDPEHPAVASVHIRDNLIYMYMYVHILQTREVNCYREGIVKSQRDGRRRKKRREKETPNE